MLRCTLVALSCLFFLSCAEKSKQQEGKSSKDTSEIADPGSGNEEVSIPDTTTPDTTTSDTGKERPPIQAEYKTFIGDWKLPAGKEITKCVLKRLTNKQEVWVSGIHTQNNKGSHHLIIYKSAATEEQTTPFNCDPFIEVVSGETVPLMISQISEEELNFPNGIAFRFEPNQMVRIEAHYLNYLPNEITAHADITFKTIAKEDVKDEANILFYGSPDFSLPPGQVTASDVWFLDVWKDSKIFAITGHTHQYGTDVKIYKSNSEQNQGELVYPPAGQTFDWSEAPVTYFDPPLEFDGNQGFHYQCIWKNTGKKTVGFGESAEQEMCFFWAYYYPSKGYRLCINTGSLQERAPAGLLKAQECCPGSLICDLIKQFLQGGGLP